MQIHMVLARLSSKTVHQADILTVRKPVAAMSEHELQNGKADHDEDDEEVPVFVSPGEPGVRASFSVCYCSYPSSW